MYQLFCDSNCELWHTVAAEYGLKVIRMPYVLDGVEYYYDLGEKTDFKHFYERMRAGAVPTTSAINEQNYIDYFEPVLQEGKDIYYITFSHKLSATFESMDRAIAALKEKYPDRVIRTFDTKAISLGSGFQVRYAAEKYKAGATMDELEEYLTHLREHTIVYFVVDDLVYLKRGGHGGSGEPAQHQAHDLYSGGRLSAERGQDQGEQARVFGVCQPHAQTQCQHKGLPH